MEIFGAGGTQGPQPIYPRLAPIGVDAGQTVHAGAPRDHVEISPLGQMLDGISRLPEIRHEKVEEIRRQIAAGSYETTEKLELALDRKVRKLTVHSDSELICRQLTGRYKVKDANMRGYHAQATALLQQFQEVEIKCVRREENSEADRLVNEALDAAAR